MHVLCRWVGEQLDPEVGQRMRSWLAENPEGKHGTYSYSPEQYGLSTAELMPGFESYLATYDVALDNER